MESSLQKLAVVSTQPLSDTSKWIFMIIQKWGKPQEIQEVIYNWLSDSQTGSNQKFGDMVESRKPVTTRFNKMSFTEHYCPRKSSKDYFHSSVTLRIARPTIALKRDSILCSLQNLPFPIMGVLNFMHESNWEKKQNTKWAVKSMLIIFKTASSNSQKK